MSHDWRDVYNFPYREVSCPLLLLDDWNMNMRVNQLVPCRPGQHSEDSRTGKQGSLVSDDFLDQSQYNGLSFYIRKVCLIKTTTGLCIYNHT